MHARQGQRGTARNDTEGNAWDPPKEEDVATTGSSEPKCQAKEGLKTEIETSQPETQTGIANANARAIARDFEFWRVD